MIDVLYPSIPCKCFTQHVHWNKIRILELQNIPCCIKTDFGYHNQNIMEMTEKIENIKNVKIYQELNYSKM